MTRKYRVTEPRPNGLPNIVVTHKGFNKRFIPEPEYIAVVLYCGDEIETWALDSPEDVKNLKVFLDADDQGSKIIGVYKLL